jgi:hypothetical protein
MNLLKRPAPPTGRVNCRFTAPRRILGGMRILFVLLSLAVALPLAAQDAPPAPEAPLPANDAPQPAWTRRERSELPESVLRAERQTGGEVLRAERMQRDGREVYRLKVLTPDGRVRIMRDDPRERRRDAWRERSLRDRPPPPEPRPLPEPRALPEPVAAPLRDDELPGR